MSTMQDRVSQKQAPQDLKSHTVKSLTSVTCLNKNKLYIPSINYFQSPSTVVWMDIQRSFHNRYDFLLCFPDVYYYLKDPPPEFIPRFGTITMAGLLGMFLARKGNHTLT